MRQVLEELETLEAIYLRDFELQSKETMENLQVGVA